MSRFGELGHRLYTGDVSYDFVRRRRLWYALSALVLLISLASLLIRGLTLSIEFTGGSQFVVPANGHSGSHAEQVLERYDIGESRIQTARQTNGAELVQISTDELPPERIEDVQAALAERFGHDDVDDVAVSTIGSSWGSDITKKALQGLVVFLIAVVAYLSMRFEWKMATAAIVALLHDLIITAGIYSLVGFEVSPSTVVALLTILGYSLYDTVVVFDKVRENTQGLGQHSRLSYSQATNLAVNQTLVRSINTTIIALLPVAGLLFIGAGLLGAGTLKDLALALFIGMASGAYSSIFIASPLLCDMKEREPAMRQLARRVANREAAESRVAAPAGARAGSGATASAVARPGAEPGVDGAAAGGETDQSDTGQPAGVPGGSPGGSGATVRNPRASQDRRRPGGRPGAKRRR